MIYEGTKGALPKSLIKKKDWASAGYTFLVPPTAANNNNKFIAPITVLQCTYL